MIIIKLGTGELCSYIKLFLISRILEWGSANLEVTFPARQLRPNDPGSQNQDQDFKS
jgi:hypothetical protein